MDCVVLAGGQIEQTDPLYPLTSGKPKALIPFGTTTVLESVLDALSASREVDRIILTGIDHNDCDLSRFSIQTIPDQGTMVANVLAGARLLSTSSPDSAHVLFCSADIPMIDGSIVDRFVTSCFPLECAVYYSVVTRDVLEDRFPNSGRSFSRLGGKEISGGNLVVARLDVLEANSELLQLLVNARKHAWKMVRIVGFSTLFKFLFHRLSIAEIEEKAGSIIGAPARIILSPDPEVAMDVDRPYHHQLLSAVKRNVGSF